MITKSICDIAIIPPACKLRVVPLFNLKRHDTLAAGDIAHCGLGEFRKGYEIARPAASAWASHIHQLIFTTRGAGLWRDDKGQYRLAKKGDLIVYPAGCPQHYKTAANSWDKFWFHCADTDTWSFLRSDKVVLRKSLFLNNIEYMLTCYYHEAIRAHAQSPETLWHIGEALLLYLRREFMNTDSAATSESAARFEQLVQEMHGNVRTPWTLKDICRKLCFSKVHTNRFFKKKTGLTPFAYLTKCRMQHAAQQLISSSNKISMVAHMAGYTDQFAFSAAFARFHGLSPREFRRQHAPGALS
jgi:AraC-like DNA-binding protein